MQHLLPQEYVVLGDGNHIQVLTTAWPVKCVLSDALNKSSGAGSPICLRTVLQLQGGLGCRPSPPPGFGSACGCLTSRFHVVSFPQMADGQIIQYEHDGSFLQEQVGSTLNNTFLSEQRRVQR